MSMPGLRRTLSVVVVTVGLALAGLATADVACAQSRSEPPGAHQENNEWFFGWIMAAVVIVPTVLVFVLNARREGGKKTSLPIFDDANFEEEVLASQMPVLVHFAESWNVANDAAVAQTELMAWNNRGAIKVGLLEVGENPEVMARVPGLQPPAYLLFYKGRKLFHRPGLRQADDLQPEIDRALSSEGF